MTYDHPNADGLIVQPGRIGFNILNPATGVCLFASYGLVSKISDICHNASAGAYNFDYLQDGLEVRTEKFSGGECRAFLTDRENPTKRICVTRASFPDI